MTTEPIRSTKLLGAALLAVIVAAGGGYWLGERSDLRVSQSSTGPEKRKILYYYDPMVPQEHYSDPNTRSSMGMKTRPRYTDDNGSGDETSGVKIDPAAMQNLGMRVATAKIGTLVSSLNVTGSIDFNQRNVAIVQARSGGFVQRAYAHAPGDVVHAGARIADVLIPEWGGAQAEFLSVRRLGDPGLTAAARQRLRLMGMSDSLIAAVVRSGHANGTVTITTPISGVIQTLDARAGVTLTTGQTLAQIAGLASVWLNAAVPEAQAGALRIGQNATATLTAFPGETFGGRVVAILPTAQADSRTLTVRIELANRGGRLRPGMYAQVKLGGGGRPALLIPSESVIRTGARTIVMLATRDGRYVPAEVRTGRDSGGLTEVLQGLSEGEKVVTSGQFLIDSEASLTGMQVRPLGDAK